MNYESLSNALMSAPFEPNSITIIKMKGTEAIFHCASCYPRHCTAYHTVYCPTPPQRLTEMPKSKYYFLQMASYFHTLHNSTKLTRYTLAWRQHLKCPCLSISLWYLTGKFLPVVPTFLSFPCFDKGSNNTLAFASHTAPSDYIKEFLQANVLTCINLLVGLKSREDFPIYNFAWSQFSLTRVLLWCHSTFFQLYQSHTRRFNCTIINKIIFNVALLLV